MYTYKKTLFYKKEGEHKIISSKKQEGWKKNKVKVKTNIDQMGMERKNIIKKLGKGVGSGGSLRAVADQGENPTTGNIRSRNVKNRERKKKENT